MQELLNSSIANTIASEVYALEEIPGCTERLVDLLGRFVPLVLVRRYSVWKGHGLDGIELAEKIEGDSQFFERIGMAILLSDQAITPIYLQLAVNTLDRRLDRIRILIGEPGGGPLNISGKPWTPSNVTRSMQALLPRYVEGRIDWVYDVSIARSYDAGEG
jgi:hypothetical protein